MWAKADVNHAWETGSNPLVQAAHHEYAAVVGELSQANAEKGRDVAELLLQAQDIVDQSKEDGVTALIHADQNGHFSVIQHLLAANEDVNLAQRTGFTALMQAAKNGHSVVVDQRLRAHTKVDHTREDATTALLIAVKYGHSTVVYQLPQARADASHANNYGNTAFMFAAYDRHAAIVDQLLEYCFDVDWWNNEGDKPLIYAVRQKHEDAAFRLFAARADPTNEINKGASALSMLPKNSELSRKLCSFNLPHLFSRLETLWMQAKGSVLPRSDLLTVQAANTPTISPAVLPTSAFTFESVVKIRPARNTVLEGLYMSRGDYCTQCDAKGFRRTTFYVDRPGVMATFSVRLVADLKKCPVLLSNGNSVSPGESSDNRHWAQFEDLFPKPCYLLALVAGDLSHSTDRESRRCASAITP
ncbi:alanine aminopeptidase [Gracilaria domingensis]|nr:alanine aminopeptidase [Gracilaria domingensis]